MRLEDAIASALAQMTDHMWAVGTVTAVGGARVTVDVHGATVSLPYLDSYTTPAVGDVVQICGPQGRRFVLGRVAK